VDEGTDNTADYYQATVLSASDYYAFGMSMKERSWQSESYRYGFNGKEKDKDFGEETTDFGERLQNSKICRFFSPDKFKSKFPHQSPYVFAGNMPIAAIDVNGDSIYIVIDAKNVFKISDKEAATYSKIIGRDLLLRTVSGKELLNKYENSPVLQSL
jgi:RHS repeat-associated protein